MFMNVEQTLNSCFCKVKCAKLHFFIWRGGLQGPPPLWVYSLFYTCLLQGASHAQGPCCANPNSRVFLVALYLFGGSLLKAG